MATSKVAGANTPPALSYAACCASLRTAIIGLIAFGAIAAIVGGALAHAKVAFHAWESRSMTLMTVGSIALLLDGGVLCITRKSAPQSKSTAQIPQSAPQAVDEKQSNQYQRRMKENEFMVVIKASSGEKQLWTVVNFGGNIGYSSEPFTEAKYQEYTKTRTEVAPAVVIARAPLRTY